MFLLLKCSFKFTTPWRSQIEAWDFSKPWLENIDLVIFSCYLIKGRDKYCDKETSRIGDLFCPTRDPGAYTSELSSSGMDVKSANVWPRFAKRADWPQRTRVWPDRPRVPRVRQLVHDSCWVSQSAGKRSAHEAVKLKMTLRPASLWSVVSLCTHDSVGIQQLKPRSY